LYLRRGERKEDEEKKKEGEEENRQWTCAPPSDSP
jgi:hypothetical protein